MEYGFAVTDAGRYLIARLLTGESMTITKIMVGSGKIPDDTRLSSMTGLITPVAQAVSDEPKCRDGVAFMTIEYNNSLNGGLETGFFLNEFGIWAMDSGAGGEVMIAYGTLGDHPQYVAPFNAAIGVDVRRFPVAIAIGEDRGMVVEYKTSLWLTAEDLADYFNLTMKPLIAAKIDEKIDAHNRDPEAHFGMERILNLNVYPRLALAEAVEELTGFLGGEHVGYENEFIHTFPDIYYIDLQHGNHNRLLCRIEF